MLLVLLVSQNVYLEIENILRSAGRSLRMMVVLQSKVSTFSFLIFLMNNNTYLAYAILIGYNIERKEKGSKKWTKLNKDLVKV